MKNASILVTGGAGFLGAHTASALLKMGSRVTVLDDLSGGFKSNVPAGAQFVEGSILDYELLNGLFQKNKFDYVFHLAAYAAEGLSHFIRRFNYQNNLVGSVNLINLSAKHKIKRFVFTSSIAVYGTTKPPVTEDTHPEPEDPYGVSKFAVEMDLKCACSQFGLKYTIFRPHNVYGELQNIWDPYRNVIGIFIKRILLGEPLIIFGDGTQTRAFSYVDDVVRPMVESIQVSSTENQVFNVGADTPFSVNELAETVMSSLGKKVSITRVAARNEVLHAYSDHSKIRKHFPHLNAPLSLADGISRMANWAKHLPPQQTKLFTDVELWDGMPETWVKLVK